MNRLREWQRAHPLSTVWVAMGVIVVASLWAQGVQARHTAHALQRQTLATAERLQAERERGREQLCFGIETFTNKLIELPTTNRTTPQAQRQAQVDSLQASLDQGFSGFGCVFHLSPAPP